MQSSQKPTHGQASLARQHRPEAVASSGRTRDPELALTEAEFARVREMFNPAPSSAAVPAHRPARSVAEAVLELLRAAELERSPNERELPLGRWWRYANRLRWTPAYKGDLAPANEGPAEPPPVPFDIAWRSTGRW